MSARMRSSRALLLLMVAAVVATGLVLAGAGPAEQAHAAVSPGTTQLVSADQRSPFLDSGQAAISADGRYVAFATLQSLDPQDVHRDGDSDLDVYVRDLREQKTILLSHGVLLPLDNVVGTDGLPDVLTTPANGHSGNPSISADGRYVAFQTTATNLGAIDHDTKSDVVVVDRDPDGDGVFDEKGCPLLQMYCHEFTRVSPDQADDQGRPLAGAGAPSISAAGDSVAWVGVALPETTPGTTPGLRAQVSAEVRVEVGSGSRPDRPQGIPVVYRSTLRKGPTGALTGVRSQQVNARAEGIRLRGETAPVLSGDGRRLALVAQVEPAQAEPATGAPAGESTLGAAVLGVDLAAGPLPGTGDETFAATRLDVDENGRPLSLPSGFPAAPTMSGDGGLVAFAAPGADSQVVRTVSWDTAPPPAAPPPAASPPAAPPPAAPPNSPPPAAAPPPVLRSAVVSTDTSGNPVHGSDPALSASGRYLAFTTAARNTHNGVDGPETRCGSDRGGSDQGGGRGSGLALSIDLDLVVDIDPLLYLGVDVDVDVWLGLGLSLGLGHASSQASEPSVEGSYCDVVVRDLVLDQTRAAANLPRLPAELASPSLARDCAPDLAATDTCEGNGASGHPVLSADGGVVAYESKATTLVPDDPNGPVQDVFARTFEPRLAADPLDFFTVAPGSATLGTSTLRHVGFGPLPVESLTISGGQAADFTVTADTCLGRTLHAGQDCLVTVRFAPSEVGAHEAALEVRYRGGGSPLVVPLRGRAETQPPRAFTADPDPLGFGETLPLSPSSPGDVTVRNTGAAPMTIDTVALPTDVGPDQFPQDYAIVTDGCTGRTLPPGDTCTVTLRHTPQGPGARPTVLRFDDNAPNSPHLVALQGSGTPPRLQFNPAVVTESRVTTLSGTGFPAQRSVIITIPELPAPIVVTTDAAGNFSTPVVIFPNATEGERRAEAVVDGQQPPITATATVLIVPGTLSPPDFRNRS